MKAKMKTLDELKPVRCGCGGEAKIGKNEWHYDTGTIEEYYVYCEECLTATGAYDTEAEAITAWNRAMGKIPVKVEVVTAKNGRTWEQCSRCFNEVYYNLPYCPGCGARLEWNE